MKVTILGAGSTVFMRNIVSDILLDSHLGSCTISLQDIDPKRLSTSKAIAQKVADTLGATARIDATLDRRLALANADFVIVMIQVGGYRPSTVIDFEIPSRYGLRQTIGDTLGIGGIMRGLRTVPVLHSIANDMMEVCPDALMLQYVNPMAINCLALSELVPELRCVGLCHSVQGTVADLARDLDVNVQDITYDCAGINHMAFYTRLERQRADGTCENLYPMLAKVADNRTYGTNWDGCKNHVRYALLKKLGYFVTESSEHFAEYTPWYLKSHRPDLVEDLEIPIDEYPRRCEAQIADWTQQEQQLLNGNLGAIEPSIEYAARIIKATVTDVPDLIYGNVRNDGLIPNLSPFSCVEVPCDVDARGITPRKVAPLPLHLARLMETNISVQQLTVDAIVSQKRQSVYHAAMLDPRTAAELCPDQIVHMVDDLLDAHGDWIPELAP